MSKRTCYLCGQPAKGYARVWNSKTGERWYCHGDDGPDCYREATVYSAQPRTYWAEMFDEDGNSLGYTFHGKV